ncbi:MAG TPA: DNA methyltransferase [Candidatus Lokiarchaeia archaeon]|nr:DNA methyltransferase [Candidatus Lokiarchaeia archaeon]
MTEQSRDKEELLANGGESRGFYDLKNRLNDLTGKEWIFSTKSVIPKSYPPSFQHQLRNSHGGQKPPELCAEIIKAFTKRNDVVLDPFAGVGGTLLGCTICGRIGIGIEINKDWIDIYKQVCELEHLHNQAMIHGDSRVFVSSLREPVDFLLTDIPYWNMDKVEKSKGTYKRANEAPKGVFSDKSKLSKFDEFAPASKDKWLAILDNVFKSCFAILKNKGYVAVFVGNMYNKGEFHFLTADVAALLKSIGFILKGEIIWYDVAKKLHLYGINYEWIPSMVHQSILVFYKHVRAGVEVDGDEVKAQNKARIHSYNKK